MLYSSTNNLEQNNSLTKEMMRFYKNSGPDSEQVDTGSICVIQYTWFVRSLSMWYFNCSCHHLCDALGKDCLISFQKAQGPFQRSHVQDIHTHTYMYIVHRSVTRGTRQCEQWNDSGYSLRIINRIILHQWKCVGTQLRSKTCHVIISGYRENVYLHK